jgi:hypothetical protein
LFGPFGALLGRHRPEQIDPGNSVNGIIVVRHPEECEVANVRPTTSPSAVASL